MANECGYTTEKCDRDSWRVFDPTGEIVGFAIALMNGRWSANDTHGGRIERRTFETPQHVRDWFSERASS
jgi:hypothetical protein